MRILVDLDDTIFKTMDKVIEVFNTKNNLCGADRKTLEDIKSWGAEKYLIVPGVDNYVSFYDIIQEDGFYSYLEPFDEDTVHAIRCLNNRHTIHFTTTLTDPAMYPNIVLDKVKGLQRILPEFEFSDITFTSDKGNLIGDVLIDDRPYNLQSFRGVKILIGRPWNRGGNYQTVHGWRAIVSNIKRLEEANRDCYNIIK